MWHHVGGRRQGLEEELSPHRERTLVPVGPSQYCSLAPDQVVCRSCHDPGPPPSVASAPHSSFSFGVTVSYACLQWLPLERFSPRFLASESCSPAHRHRALCFIFEACGVLPGDFAWSSEAGLKGQENLASTCGLALRWGGCDLKASRPVAAPDVLNALKSPFDKPCKKHGVSLDSHLIFGRLVTHLFTRFGVESLLAIYKVICHSWHRFHYTCSGE